MHIWNRAAVVVTWMLGAAAVSSQAHAATEGEVPPDTAPSTNEGHWPKLGGHLGVATPYLKVSKQTSVLGREGFFTIVIFADF